MINETHIYLDEADKVHAGSGSTCTLVFFGETVTMSMPLSVAQRLVDALKAAGITPTQPKQDGGRH